MNELIKITYQNDEPAVSARDLHEFLEVETPYRIWFPRMQEYGFTEGEDFNPYKNVRVQQEGDREVTRTLDDAILSLDMAKEICMLQRNEKGKQARKYFIQLEKDWHDPQKVLARAMPEVWEQVNTLEQRMNDLTAVNDLLLDLDSRLTQLERRIDPPSGLMSIADVRPALPRGAGAFTPGLMARKRWMRTASEKLDLMSARFNTTHNEILHSLYQHLEKRCKVVLEEEKLKAMEEYNLVDCSVLTAIFYNAELRDAFEENIDYNLAPENRGW